MAYKHIRLYQISSKMFEVGKKYDYSIYYQNKGKFFKKLLSENAIFDNKIKIFIKKNKIKNLFIKTLDYPKYKKDMEIYVKKILSDENIDISIKADLLHESVSEIINSLLTQKLNYETFKQAESLIEEKTNLLLNDQTASKAILEVTTYDYYTYTHCVNVSTYAMTFALFLNLSQNIIKLIGKGGLLHDLGKREIPPEIVNKKGKLTDQEFEIMKKHPTLGVKLLKELGENNKIVLNCVEQHHENLDGSGYPNRLKSKDISIYSQIVKIADIFDALTTKRSYKPPLKTFDAFKIMKKMENEIKVDLLEKFIIFMSEQ